jgi:hypothetical protein
MEASGEGVAALHCWLAGWLVEEYANKMNVVAVQLGRKGIAKQIFLVLARPTLKLTTSRPSSTWRAC